MGFLAGGLSALLATHALGVVGYIGLDPFDRPGGAGLDAARQNQAIASDFLRRSVRRAMPPDLQADVVARPAQGKVHEMPDEAQHKP
jgi:hypothetical protein